MKHADSAALLYWTRVRQLTGVLMLIWFIATFCVIFFARETTSLTLFGWPFSFYMAAQGSTLIYLLIIGIYALAMKKLDALASSETGDEA